jgi:hypothetical protein
VEACDAEDNCSTLQSITQFAVLTEGSTNTVSIGWNGGDTITYTVNGSPTPYTIDTASWPVLNGSLTTADVGFGIAAFSNSSATTTGRFDNIALSTDGSTFSSYDTFSVADGSYDGGGKWYRISGYD